LFSPRFKFSFHGVSSTSCLIELLCQLTHFITLPTTDFVQFSKACFRDVAMSFDKLRKSHYRSERAFDVSTPLTCFGSSRGVGSESTFEIVASFTQELLTLSQAGNSHIEVLATEAEVCRPRID
jgi:hypothetical protein